MALRAVALGASGGLVLDVSLTWRLLDPRAGSITQNGIFVAGEAPGPYVNALEVQARKLGGGQAPVTDTATVKILSLEELQSDVRAVIAPDPVIGVMGGVHRMVLHAFDHQGRPVPTGIVEWKGALPQVGSIGPDGRLILGDVPGEYRDAVTARTTMSRAYGGGTVEATMSVVIRPSGDLIFPSGAPGQTIMFPRELRLRLGDRGRLSLVSIDSQGNPFTPTDVRWSVAQDVARVDGDGRVTATADPGRYPGAIRAEIRGVVGAEESPLVLSATLVVLGEMSRVEVFPSRAVLERGEITQFQAFAYDASGSRLFDVTIRWEMEDSEAGSITSGGLFIAGDNSGEYLNAVRVRARQSKP